MRRSKKPFGGIQLILCGDFCQLPPVTAKGQTKRFCFQVFHSFIHALTEIYSSSLVRACTSNWFHILRLLLPCKCNKDADRAELRMKDIYVLHTVNCGQWRIQGGGVEGVATPPPPRNPDSRKIFFKGAYKERA